MAEKIKVKLKMKDAMINTKILSKEDRLLLRENNINYNYISFSKRRNATGVIEALKYNKKPFTRKDLDMAFLQQDEEYFDYLFGLSNLNLYVEINRTLDYKSFNFNIKLGLGLKRFEYHDVSNYDSEEDIISFIDEKYIVHLFFYRSIEALIYDIRKVMNERKNNE